MAKTIIHRAGDPVTLYGQMKTCDCGAAIVWSDTAYLATSQEMQSNNGRFMEEAHCPACGAHYCYRDLNGFGPCDWCKSIDGYYTVLEHI